MTTIIDKQGNIDNDILTQLVDLIGEGKQVQRRYIESGLEAATLIALLIDNNKIISSATLKNPRDSYRDKVFRLAGIESRKGDFAQELGYIVTNPEYQRQGHCQNLLVEFFKIIDNQNMFATSRRPSMVHILKKNFGFKKLGNTYNEDLELFIYNGKK